MHRFRLGAGALVLVIALLAPAASWANHVDDRTDHIVVQSYEGNLFLSNAMHGFLDSPDPAVAARIEATVGADRWQTFLKSLTNLYLPAVSRVNGLNFDGVSKHEWCPRFSQSCWYFQRDDRDVHDPPDNGAFYWDYLYTAPVPDDGNFFNYHYSDLAGKQDFFVLWQPNVAWQEGGNPCGPEAGPYGADLALASESGAAWCGCLVPPTFSCSYDSRRGTVWRDAKKGLTMRIQPDDPDVPNNEFSWYPPVDWESTVANWLSRDENLDVRNALAHELAPQAPPPPPPPPPPPLDYEALLQRYAPYLAYESQELYFADSPGEQTDNYVLKRPDKDKKHPKVERTNALKRGGVTFAESFPSSGLPTLSLDYLGTYGGIDGDLIDEGGTEYQADAARMHAQDLYGNRYYGRVVQDPATGRHWLQYWFFYYYNSQTAGITNTGAHEGDWEMIQIVLNDDGTPDRVAYAQHNGGQSCGWTEVERAFTGEGYQVPVVYVANASHASYPSVGVTSRGILPDDEHRGDRAGGPVRPRFHSISAAPGWATWPGRWGGSDSEVKGPLFHGSQSNAPSSWDDGLDHFGCTPGTFKRLAKTSRKARYAKPPSRDIPPAPKISARRSGGQVVVDYSLASLGAGRGKVRWILVTVDPASPRFAPAGRAIRVRGLRGRTRLRVPIGTGPYRARASTISVAGSKSGVVSARVVRNRR